MLTSNGFSFTLLLAEVCKKVISLCSCEGLSAVPEDWDLGLISLRLDS